MARNVVYLWNAWLAVKYVNVTFIYMEIGPGMSLPLECMHGCLVKYVNVTCTVETWPGMAFTSGMHGNETCNHYTHVQ